MGPVSNRTHVFLRQANQLAKATLTLQQKLNAYAYRPPTLNRKRKKRKRKTPEDNASGVISRTAIGIPYAKLLQIRISIRKKKGYYDSSNSNPT